jgi:hypothetical protein
MGGGESASQEAVRDAYRLGELIAEQGWVLLTGGRAVGVMDAASAGARSRGGLVIGVLPGRDTGGSSEHLDIPVITGLGEARNIINVLTSRVVIACAGGAGTLSEIALALKSGRPVILLNFNVVSLFERLAEPGNLLCASTPEEAVAQAHRLLST